MTAFDFAILLLRIVLGLTMAAHGYNKFSGGGRIPGTAGWFDSIGMRPGQFHARVAATTEVSAGLGLAVGLLTAIPAAGFVALMLVAAWTVHRRNGFFIVKEGWEYNLILAIARMPLRVSAPEGSASITPSFGELPCGITCRAGEVYSSPWCSAWLAASAN